MIDGGQAYTVKRAAQLLRRVEDVDLYWFEEPLAPDDHDGYRRLSAAVDRANRRRGGRLDDRPLPALWSSTVTSTCSSPTSRAAAASRSPGRSRGSRANGDVEVVPHCFSTGVLVAASLHFAATLDRPTLLRVLGRRLAARRRDARRPVRAATTVGSPSRTGPGLGIELDERLLDRLRLD